MSARAMTALTGSEGHSPADPVLAPSVQDGLAFLDRNVDDMVALLAKLIAVDTCFPPGQTYDQFADLINEVTKDLGGKREKILVPDDLWKREGVFGDRVNLLITPDVDADRDQTLQIYFHTDTAPLGEGWTHPPLTLSEEGERLYGRGTADMKGAMAAAIGAIRALKATGTAAAFRPTLLFCTDEEGGTFPGIRYLAEEGFLTGEVLNLNGSAIPRIWAGCFGSLDFRIRFIGKGAHSGAPGDGINAAEEALGPIAALMQLKQIVEQRHSSLPAPPGSKGPLHARLSLTALRGGEKGSALPGQLEIIVNRRYAPEELADDVIAEIQDVVAKAVSQTRLIGHQVEIVGHLPPVVDPDGPATQRWTAAQSAGFGFPIEDYLRFGSSTSTDFGWVQKSGRQHIMLGGLSRPDRSVHGPDEHTTRSDLLGLARSIFLFLAQGFDPRPDCAH